MQVPEELSPGISFMSQGQGCGELTVELCLKDTEDFLATEKHCGPRGSEVVLGKW